MKGNAIFQNHQSLVSDLHLLINWLCHSYNDEFLAISVLISVHQNDLIGGLFLGKRHSY